MIIDRKKMSAFARRSEAEFAGQMALLLQEQFEEARQVPAEELRADITRLLPGAAACGLNSERDTAVYVIAAFVLGEDFKDEFPAAGEVLTSPVLNAADKAQWLEEWTNELFQTLEQAEE